MGFSNNSSQRGRKEITQKYTKTELRLEFLIVSLRRRKEKPPKKLKV